MASTHIKDSGIWRTSTEIHVKSGGVWRDIISGYIFYAVWRLIFAKPVFEEYIYTGAQQTTLTVTAGTNIIIFAGVAQGGNSDFFGPVSSEGGGGGGAANLSGYTINPAAPYVGTTLYIGVGGPTAPRNTYVRTSNHFGPIIFELNQGSNGIPGNPVPTNYGPGGAANPTYGTTAGGPGGPGGPRFVAGGPGASVSNAAAGGGGGGGYGDNSPLIAGSPGGNGGNVTMSPPSYLQPVGHTPWTWGSSSTGGAGGTRPGPGEGSPAPSSGASGGNSPGPTTYDGTGGGGGAGIILNGVSYGGGGGGHDRLIGPPAPGGLGAPGFLIVQFKSS